MGFRKLSLSMDEELLADIDFDILKVEGKIEPNNSYGKYFYKKLRDTVPHRNVQVTDEDGLIDNDDNSRID